MTLTDLLLNEEDLRGLPHNEFLERLIVCRHVPEFEFYYEKYAGKLTSEEARLLYLSPSELFYQVRNYALYLLMPESDERDLFRISVDFVSRQRAQKLLAPEELELLRQTLSFMLRHRENNYISWSVACDIFLREPFDEDSRDYHEMLMDESNIPEQATVAQRDRLLAWGEIDPDMLLEIVGILRKHHKSLGRERLGAIKEFIELKCSEATNPTGEET